MQILVAKHAGFCFGVKNAIEIAKDVASENNSKTYVKGHLVHNEMVLEDLKKQGLVFVDDAMEIPEGATTVLRAHGEPGSTYTELKKRSITVQNNNLKDATCPLVTLVHRVAITLKKNGYEVLLFGKPEHPESIGTSYYLKGKETFFIWDPEDYGKAIEHLRKNNFGKAAFISQTTMSMDGYSKLIGNINKNSEFNFEDIPLNMNKMDIKYGYVDTICMPTKQRQTDTEEVAKKADVMLVIGGKNSSNTKELVAKCRSLGVETYFIQSEEQVKKEWIDGKEIVGVTAGASTPDDIIKSVVGRIRELDTQ